MGILAMILKKFKPNIWIIALSLLFFPIAIFSNYFPDFNRVLYGSVTVLQMLIYPFVKLLIVLSLVWFIMESRKKEKN
jgi:hypothetical protein